MDYFHQKKYQKTGALLKALKNVIFKDLNEQKYLKITSSGAYRELQYNEWCINLYQYIEDNWKIIFQNLTQTSIQCLSVYDSQNPKILLDIKQVKFQKLRQLNLEHNKINNIQHLTLLRCSKLKHLCLGNNKITNLSPFFKTYFYELKSIHLQGNLIKVKYLQRLFLNKRDLSCSKTIFFFNLQDGNSLRQCEDISCFFKAETKINFSLNTLNHITQKKVRQNFRNKMIEPKQY